MGKLAQAIPSEASGTRDVSIRKQLTFLGSGAQFYAFTDGENVVKFFKTHHGMMACQSTMERRLKRLFKSALLAKNDLQRETGILSLHLEKTENVWGKVTLCDRLHIAHTIDLDKTAFIVQKRAVPAAVRLSEQLTRKDLAGAKASIIALLNLAEQTAQHGIKNKDIKLVRNCGFVGDDPLIIDFGSISPRKRSRAGAPLRVRKKAHLQLKRWLHRNYPQYEDIL